EDIAGRISALLSGTEVDPAALPLEREGRPARVALAPVRKDGRTLAAVTVETSGHGTGAGTAEAHMDELGSRLLRMMACGAYPIAGAPIPPRRGAPRVGDGIVQLDETGVVRWASPNALSAFHRFGIEGDMRERSLAELSTEVIQSRAPVDESLPLVLMGRAAWRSDMQARGGTLSLRAVPLTEAGKRIGAIVLVRDVTELRRRERELITKDAT